MLPIKTILHPTDFSDASDHARQMAYDMARDYGAVLILLHVVEPPVFYGELGVKSAATVSHLDTARMRVAALEDAEDPVRVETLVIEGIAAAEILRVAAERQCDLLVIGSHGRGGLGRILMGSVAEEVSRKSPCPVLIVRERHNVPHDHHAAPPPAAP
jgi:nucleotide-binding universal stress UspA family protein